MQKYKLICYTKFNPYTVVPIPYTLPNTNTPAHYTYKQANTTAQSLHNTQHPSCVQKAIIQCVGLEEV